MRGTGRTTYQMVNAPKEAVFVWCNGYVGPAKDLAQSCNRNDLKIVGPHWLERNQEQRGLVFSGIVLDHDFGFENDQQRDGYKRLLTQVR